MAEVVVGLVLIPPGEPWRNGYVEPIHSRRGEEFLGVTTFTTALQARVELTDWHHEWHRVSRHSGLGRKTPGEYADTCACTTPG
jgi:transposase InsO family protein